MEDPGMTFLVVLGIGIALMLLVTFRRASGITGDEPRDLLSRASSADELGDGSLPARCRARGCSHPALA